MATNKNHHENTAGRVQEVHQKPGADAEDWELVDEDSFEYHSGDEKSVEKSIQDAIDTGITESGLVDNKQAGGEITGQKEEDVTTDVDDKLAAKREKKREKRRAYKKRAQQRRAQEKEQENDTIAGVTHQNEQDADQDQQKLAATLAEVTFAKKQIDDEIRSLQNAQKIAQNMVDQLNEEMAQKMSSLGIDDKETEKNEAMEAFLAALKSLDSLNSDWDKYFGEGELEDWQRLCGDLRLPTDLPSKTKCRKAIRKINVNIRQFLDAVRKPEDVIFFKNVHKLALWSRKSKKSVPKFLIKSGSPMRALMREFSRHY